MANLSNCTYDEIEIGRSDTISLQVSKTEVEALALVTGDVDSFHVDAEEAARGEEAGTVTQALGTEALLSSLLNRRMPGPGTIILGHNLRFQGRVAVGDVLTATVIAKEKRSYGRVVVFDCRCVNQRGEVLAQGSAEVAAPDKRIAYTDIATPEVILRHNDGFVQLLKKCGGLAPEPCAVVHPCDRDSLLGAIEAAKRGLIVPVLVGPEAKIQAIAVAEGVDLSPYRLVSTEHSHAAAEKAVAMARAGDVAALMKGSLHTDELMRAVVSSATGLRTERRISHVFVMDVPAYPRTLFITDAAINLAPNARDKADIVQNAIDLAHVLGIECPRVAILAAVETVNPDMPSTVDAAMLCKMADRGQITGGILDGPLAFDNAINEDAARTKKIVSPVAGKADILLVPDLEAGNMVAKQLQYLAGAQGAGIVLGARVPIVLTSRADNIRARLASTAVLKLVANAKRSQASGAALGG